ncbi:MAG: hypothetical protein PSN37_03280 [Alphaproteobacteria bacterium]|nr:hypothetical protein [Alphaproteobacteria bacterium]
MRGGVDISCFPDGKGRGEARLLRAGYGRQHHLHPALFTFTDGILRGWYSLAYYASGRELHVCVTIWGYDTGGIFPSCLVFHVIYAVLRVFLFSAFKSFCFYTVSQTVFLYNIHFLQGLLIRKREALRDCRSEGKREDMDS